MKISRRIKRNISHRKSKLLVSLAAMLMVATLAGQVFAAPTGGTVVRGVVDISNPAAIQVNANGIINWQSFNLATGEAVNFNFLSSANAIVNRVTGGGASQIAGLISSSGNSGAVFLVNPAGIVFNNGAQINVPNFVASTLDATDDDFLKMMQKNIYVPLTNKANGNIQINGLTLGDSNKNFAAFGNSVEIAPGVTLSTATSPSLGSHNGNGMIHLMAVDSAELELLQDNPDSSFTAIDENNMVTKAGDTIIMGKGSTLSTGNLDMYGNTIDINGTADSPATIILYGGSYQEDGTALDAFNTLASADADDSHDTTYRIAGTATSANAVNISYANIGTAGDGVNSSGLWISGGKVAMDHSNLYFGGIHDPYFGDEVHNFGNEVHISAGNSIVSTGGDEMGEISTAWVATKDNTINISSSRIESNTYRGSVLPTNRVSLLGGQITVSGTDISCGEFFAGAGSQMSLDKVWDQNDPQSQYSNEYFFGNQGSAAAGQTVSFDKDTTLTAIGQSAIYANAITNNGTIIANNQYGIHLWAFDQYNGSKDKNSGDIQTGPNSTITNNGTITTNQLGIMGNQLNNNGAITINDKGQYASDAALAGQLTGNAIQGTNVAGSLVQGKNDPAYNADKPFNHITYSSTTGYSFSTTISTDGGSTDAGKTDAGTTAAVILSSGVSLDGMKEQIVKLVGPLTSATDTVSVIEAIRNSNLAQSDKNELFTAVVAAYVPTQGSLRITTGQIDAGVRSNKSTPATDDPVVDTAPVGTGITVSSSANVQ